MNTALVLEISLPFCTLNTQASISCLNREWYRYVKKYYFSKLHSKLSGRSLWYLISNELQKCVICKKGCTTEEYNSVYDFYIHDKCLLENTIPRFMLKRRLNIPTNELKSIPCVQYYGTLSETDNMKYYCPVVWKEKHDCVIYVWTAEYLVNKWATIISQKFQNMIGLKWAEF